MIRLLVVSVLALGSSIVMATPSAWRFSGFINLGLTRGDSTELGFKRDITQYQASFDGKWRSEIDSSVGLQLNWQWSSACDASAQLLFKQRYNDDAADHLEWAFLRCRLDDQQQLRVGRLGLDVFMLSDYRHVGYAYPFVRPPHDFYAFLSLYRFDGIDYTVHLPWQDRRWNVMVFGGNAKTDRFSTGFSDFDVEAKPLYGVRLSYEDEIWRWRFNHSVLNLTTNVDASALFANAEIAESLGWVGASAIAHETAFDESPISYTSIGFSFDNNEWWMQGEFARLKGDHAPLPDNNSFNVNVGYRVGDWLWLITGGASHPLSDTDMVTVPTSVPEPFFTLLQPLALELSKARIGSRTEQSSVGVGVRWDYASKQALKLQYEHIHVGKYGSGLWEGYNYFTAAENVNVISVQWVRVF